MTAFSVLYGDLGNLSPSTQTSRNKQLVNEALRDIARRRRWSWLMASTSVPLVAGTRSYVLAGTSPVITDYDGLIAVRLEITAAGAQKKLKRMRPDVFMDTFEHTGAINGIPAVFSLQGGTAATTSATVVSGGQLQLVLNCPPTAVAGQGVNLIIHYWRGMAGFEMVADSDVPILPTQHHDVLQDAARARVMRVNYREQDAQIYEQKFQDGLAVMMAEDAAITVGDLEELAIVNSSITSNASLQPQGVPGSPAR